MNIWGKIMGDWDLGFCALLFFFLFPSYFRSPMIFQRDCLVKMVVVFIFAPAETHFCLFCAWTFLKRSFGSFFHAPP